MVCAGGCERRRVVGGAGDVRLPFSGLAFDGARGEFGRDREGKREREGTRASDCVHLS